MSGSSPPLLETLGWDASWGDAFDALAVDGAVPARVARQDRGRYRVLAAAGEWEAVLGGRLAHEAGAAGPRPAVGDWVAVVPRPGEDRADIRALLARRTRIARREAGDRTREQILAANVDRAFLVAALDPGRGFSLRRLERLLVLCREGGVEPVVVLNKADLSDDPEAAAARAEGAAPGERVVVASAAARTGLDALRGELPAGRTAVFLGPSGVGKSTLINALLGTERQEVGDVRAADQRGRHTTTSRELVTLPWGGLVIDTPGIREVALWAGQGDVRDGFADVEALAARCRYRDCRHEREPGCAVHRALGEGTLDRERYESYLELRREAQYLEDRKGYLAAKEEKFKKIGQWVREIKKRGKR